MDATNLDATFDRITDNIEDMKWHVERLCQLVSTLILTNPKPKVQIPCGEIFPKEVAAQTCEGLSHQGKDEHTHERQCKITISYIFTLAISYTLVHMDDERVTNKSLSVSSSLPTYEYIDFLPLVDNVNVVRVDTLVDPIDDRIDSSSKIDLCPPSVEAIVLNESTSSYENCVDQLMCKTYPPLENMCDMINEVNRVLDISLELDNDSLESESSKSVHGLDHSLFSIYANPLWCDNIPPKDGNFFLEDESTLKGKECVVLETTSSSTLCGFFEDTMMIWRKPYVIPAGGSNSLGIWGYIEAIREIEQQLQHSSIERKFDDVVVDCGSVLDEVVSGVPRTEKLFIGGISMGILGLYREAIMICMTVLVSLSGMKEELHFWILLGLLGCG
ncbi:hypothetical protein FXO38_15873 [Capsicum annuum]|nr:hypothetical protein FXO38_15873 [Capsicum annuum]